MIDDQDTDTSHVIIARSIALADATTADDDIDNMSVPQPEVSPQSAVVPTKLWNSNDVCVQHFFTMQQLDVTDGNWHDLPMGQTSGLNTNGVRTENLINELLAINISDLVGNPIGLQDITLWSRETRSQNQLFKYVFAKLNNVNVELGNFSVTIERDASGGIQFKDNPIFEVCFAPNLSINTETDDGRLMPNSSFSTDLKAGISYSMNISSSLFILDELCMQYKIPKTGKSVWYFPTIAEFLTNNYPDNVKVGWSMPPRCWLDSPTFSVKIRMVNVPRGVSNIKIYLAYTSNTKAHWTGMCYQDENHLIFPQMGTAVPTALINIPYSIIRQIHPRDPLAMYLSVENNKIEYTNEQLQLLNKYKNRKRQKSSE